MANVLDKVLKYHDGKVLIFEIVAMDGDYVMFIGQMGPDDNPHYLIANAKYGVVEAGSGALEEAYKLFEFCLGRKRIAKPQAQPDLFN